MAGVGGNYLTLTDLAKRKGGEWEKEATIIELLAETNELLQDAHVEECNDGAGHKTIIRTGLPTATWRKLYQGVDPSKSETAQVRDTTGMLEAYSEVDKSLVDLAPNKEKFRLDEANAFLEAMNQEMQDCLIYGSVADNAAKFDGLSVRYDSIATAKTNIGSNIINAGAEGNDNTSIWFITFGHLHTHLIYPKGSKAGVQHEDKGQQTKVNSDNSMYEVMRDHFKWDVGMSVRDWRSTCRIANIDVSLLGAGSALTGTKYVEDVMIEAYHKINRYRKTGRTFVYANQEVATALHKRAKDKASNLSIGEYAGKPITMFLDLPIRTIDQILNTEELVA